MKKSPKIRSSLPKLASGKHSEACLGKKILSNLKSVAAEKVGDVRAHAAALRDV